MRVSRRRFHAFRHAVFHVMMVVVALALAGCSSLSLPAPGGEPSVPRISDLKAEVSPRGIELRWMVPEMAERRLGSHPPKITVLRADLPPVLKNCPDCPPPHQESVQVIDPAAPKPALVNAGRFLWVDRNIFENHSYRYQIAFHDRLGKTLSLSNPVTVQVAPRPAAPSALRATQEAQGILLHWTPPKEDDRGQPLTGPIQFSIERRAGNSGVWETITPTLVREASFFDPAVVSAQTYEYRVCSVVVLDSTPIRGTAVTLEPVKAPDALPPPPPDRIWVVPCKGALEIHWTESAGAVGGYHVYRKEGTEIIRLTATPLQHPPFTDQQAQVSRSYHYAVSAVGTDPSLKEGLLSKWTESGNP